MKKKNAIVVGILTAISACFVGCLRTELPIGKDLERPLATVSKTEAEAFIKDNPTPFYEATTRGMVYKTKLTEQGDSIRFAVLPAKTTYRPKHLNRAKLALFKDKKGVIRGFIVGIYPATHPKLKSRLGYSGPLFFWTMDGKLLLADYYVDGRHFDGWDSAQAFIGKLLKEESDLFDLERMMGIGWCSFHRMAASECPCDYVLEEVFVVAKRRKTKASSDVFSYRSSLWIPYRPIRESRLDWLWDSQGYNGYDYHEEIYRGRRNRGRRSLNNRPTKPKKKKPCPGDPVMNPEIAPQKGSKIKGGMFGWARRDEDGNPINHKGIDLKAIKGSPIYAMYDGRATLHTQFNKKTGKIDGAGYFVVVSSVINGKWVAINYCHLKEKGRVMGRVKKGQLIGYLGDSGNLKNAIEKGYTVSHVHIRINVGIGGGKHEAVDPIPYLTTKIDPKTGKVIKKCK